MYPPELFSPIVYIANKIYLLYPWKWLQFFFFNTISPTYCHKIEACLYYHDSYGTFHYVTFIVIGYFLHYFIIFISLICSLMWFYVVRNKLYSPFPWPIVFTSLHKIQHNIEEEIFIHFIFVVHFLTSRDIRATTSK